MRAVIPCSHHNQGATTDSAPTLAKRRLEHVAKAIWFAEWEEFFPPRGTIQYALAMQMAVAATEALAEAMEWEA